MKGKFLNIIIGYKKLTFANWLTIIGGIVIFISWLVERNFQTKWTDEKEKLKRSQLVIDITETRRSILEVSYFSEVMKKPIDSLHVAFLQQRLAQTYLDLLTWSKGRVTDKSDDYLNLIKSKQKIVEENQTCFINDNYEKIDSNFNLVVTVFGINYTQLDKEFSNKFQLVQEKEDLWANLFTFLYVLGSSVLGLSFILEISKIKDN